MEEGLNIFFKTLLGLKINLKRCILGVQKLTFSGFKLTNKGMFSDSSKIDAVTNAQVPTNATEVRSFLGLGNYFSQFIPNYADLTAPLRNLTKKNTLFKRTNENQNSFEKLKAVLINSEIMAYYLPDAKAKVIVHASPVGLGVILSKQKMGEFQPVAYASKSLNPTEQRYSQTERERV